MENADSSLPLPDRLKPLRALIDRYESEDRQKLSTPQYDELAKALNTAWPKAYIVKTWYQNAENAGLVVIGFLVGILVVMTASHLFGPEVAACVYPPKGA